MKLKGGALLSLRKPLVFVITALLIFGTFLSTFVFTPMVKKASAAGNTYYVRADGTVLAANKANATSPNAAGTSLNMAQVNAATFAAGDQVLFSSQGGEYDGSSSTAKTLILPSGGSGVGSEITYANVPSEIPVIHNDAGSFIDTNSKTYVKVDGFSIISTKATDAYGIRIRGSYITLKNTTVNMGGYGYDMVSQDSMSNILVDSVTLTNCKSSYDSLYFFGASNTNITVQNSTIGIGTYGTDIRNATNVTISNIITTAVRLESVTTGTISSVTATSSFNSTIYGLRLSNSSGITVNDFSYSGNDYGYLINGTSNNITLNRFSAGGGAKVATITDTANNITINDSSIINGEGFANTSGSHNITFNRVISSHNSSTGFTAKGTSHDITYNNCVADYNTNNGFAPTETSYNITYWYSEASYNGKINVTADGGGIIPHDSATNIKAYYSVIHHNYNEGMSDVSTGTNFFYGGTNWANGYAIGDTFKGGTVATPSIRGNLYFAKTGGMTSVKDVISGGGKPRELLISYPQYTNFDYNLFNPINDNKFYNYGNDPVFDSSWITYHATYEPHSQNADPKFVNAPTDFSLQSTSPAIDAGIDVGLTTDYLNHAIYGAPDIGAYEYQPPEVMGTNKIDIGAGARVYADGNFRNLSVASGTSANLTITPQSGSFTVGNHALWMDIVIVVWNNTGIYHKSWTETSTVNGLNNTVHKVGDLAPNKYYNVKVDNVLGANMTGSYCTAGLCLADNNGIITFTYTGGYSTHTFDVEGGPATVASSGSSTSTTPSTPVAKFPETGIPPSHNNIPRNIFTLSGVLVLVSVSPVVFLRRRRKYSI